jgi:hypothetical protein
MVDIQRSPETDKEVYDICRGWLDKKRAGIHVSDLQAPRLAYLKKIYGNRISDKQVGMFISGIAIHGIIESLAIKWGDTKEKKIEMEGIYGSVDCTRGGLPVEVKSSRAWKSDMVSDEYVKQLKMYCTIMNKTKGYIIIFFLNVKEDVVYEDGTSETVYGPKIVCHEVNFTEDELKAEKEIMINNKDVLAFALNNKDPSNLPKCAKWKCKDCGYKVECKEIDQPKIIPVEGSNLTFVGK